jgi:hypothetical protein
VHHCLRSGVSIETLAKVTRSYGELQCQPSDDVWFNDLPEAAHCECGLNGNDHKKKFQNLCEAQINLD